MPSDTRRLANALRALAMDAVQAANSGHPGMPMGMADVATVLYSRFLKFSATEPLWADRDRFVLSAGHGSMLLYGLLHLCGYTDFPLEQLKNFRKLGSRAAGHPEYGAGGGIETTTGPLGQGLANAVGMAMAERMLAAEFGDELCSHHTWVISGDGCLMEGISHEAASLAGHLKLSKLTVLFDDNGISIDGATTLTQSDDVPARFAAYGWKVVTCDGHNEQEITAAMQQAVDSTVPTIIACRTIIGFGAPNKQGTAATHGSALGEDEVAAARDALDWTHPPFDVPDDIRTTWLAFGSRGDDERKKWQERLANHPQREEFERRQSGILPTGWSNTIDDWQAEIAKTKPAMATRQASGFTLEQLVPKIPELIGGSADLTGSNNTATGQQAMTADNYGGRYIHYGVREHGMAAAMNGMALHGGVVPYGGTFLVFSDYCRPAIRLAALMGVQVIFVMTHDSIGLGEDGPTHQPVEHLAALRAIPHLRVWRPCDALETAECWRLALLHKAPSVLALSRQKLPTLSAGKQSLCKHGAYILAAADTKADIALAASGSEVSLAMATRELLAAENINATVVSVPSLELFEEQDDQWRQQVIPDGMPLLIIEAATSRSWRMPAAAYQCLDDFGVSATAADAFNHFGFTPESIAIKAKQLLNKIG